jgi:peptidoglycan/xylan/chitin deacetylase (PgdA/CDA1 family)
MSMLLRMPLGLRLIALPILFAFAPAQAQVASNPGIAPVPIDATPEQMRNAVASARAGRVLTPKVWPGGARVAVCISFDVDNETLWRERPRPVPLSEGEYGAREGLPRILALLDRESIPATFYIPAMSAIVHPDMIPEILKRKRHEIGVHGWTHEEPSTVGDRAKEQKLLEQAIAYLTQVTGKRPVGVRAPSWDFSPYTLELIGRAGFLYDSSMMALDQPYELLSAGKPTGLIELPINWIADDYPYYEPEAAGSLPSTDGVYQIYKDEFDGAYRERTLFILTMHPHITGHRSRIIVLERLIKYMKSQPDVWFATLEQTATYVKQQQNKAN